MGKISSIAIWLLTSLFALLALESIRPGFASAWIDLHWLWVLALIALLVSVFRSMAPAETQPARWSAPLSALLVSTALLYPLLRWDAPVCVSSLLALLGGLSWWLVGTALAPRETEVSS